MAFICNAMPGYMKENLTAKLLACLGGSDKLVSQDSRRLEPFECLHFSWYNRYATDVSILNTPFFCTLADRQPYPG
jgi:hypothetical protein